MEDANVTLSVLRSAYETLQAVLVNFDQIGEALLAAQLSSLLDATDLRLGTLDTPTG